MLDLKKTVVFKIWKFPQLSETFIVNQIVLAVRMGYDVKILTGEFNDISQNADTQLFEEFNLRDKIIIEDFGIPQPKFKRILKALGMLIKDIFLFPYLFKYYKYSAKKGLLPLYEFFFYKAFRNYETIHIQYGTNKHPVDLLKMIGYLKGQIIVSFHGHDLYFPINKLIPNDGYYDVLFKEADFLVANTPFLKDKLLNLGAPEDKIEIIPVPVDTSIYHPNDFLNKRQIIKLVTVGRLDELKGQRYGIQAVNLLLEKGFSVEYTIAGTGINREKLEEQIHELGITSHVFLVGKVLPDQIAQLLSNSDIFLMTSVTNSEGMEESQGLVTAEAQSCGLPIIAFDTGGVKFTMTDGETGFLCKEKDIYCYAEKIERLIKNGNLRKKMGKNAHKFIEREYSVNSVLNKWRRIYG